MSVDIVEEVVPHDVVSVPEQEPRRWLGPAIALSAFMVLVIAVLSRSTSLLEPDDYAYRASIVALSHGWLLLNAHEYALLVKQLASGSSPGIMQWHHLASGYWISEKNPGYPFLALPFYLAHCLRIAPLFYGALGAGSLYLGGRRFIGGLGGAYAAALFCTSGAAMAFAWRATMPTFTDASLVATGVGLLLWAGTASDASRRHRTIVGSFASAALMVAVATRYTDVVVPLVAAVAILCAAWMRAIARRMAAWWLGVMALCAAGILAFNALVYGSATSTGYSSGEISFSLSAFPSNLVHMPAHLVAAMPMTLLALAAVIWIAIRGAATFTGEGALAERSHRRRDLFVGATLFAMWAGLWFLYLCYPWTVDQAAHAGTSIHIIRFYLPVIGVIALLGAWLLARLPIWASLGALVLLTGAGVESYHSLVASNGPGGFGPGSMSGPGSGAPGGHHFTPGTKGPGSGPGGFGPGGSTNGGPPPGHGGFGPPPGTSQGSQFPGSGVTR